MQAAAYQRGKGPHMRGPGYRSKAGDSDTPVKDDKPSTSGKPTGDADTVSDTHINTHIHTHTQSGPNWSSVAHMIALNAGLEGLKPASVCVHVGVCVCLHRPRPLLTHNPTPTPHLLTQHAVQHSSATQAHAHRSRARQACPRGRQPCQACRCSLRAAGRLWVRGVG